MSKQASNVKKTVMYKGEVKKPEPTPEMPIPLIPEVTTHWSYETICPTCYYVGDTNPVEARMVPTYCMLITCCSLPAFYATKCSMPKIQHRTEHYCGNCGVILAYAYYRRSQKKA